MNRVNRNKCKFCRLQKCIAVGMSKTQRAKVEEEINFHDYNSFFGLDNNNMNSNNELGFSVLTNFGNNMEPAIRTPVYDGNNKNITKNNAAKNTTYNNNEEMKNAGNKEGVQTTIETTVVNANQEEIRSENFRNNSQPACAKGRTMVEGDTSQNEEYNETNELIKLIDEFNTSTLQPAAANITSKNNQKKVTDSNIEKNLQPTITFDASQEGNRNKNFEDNLQPTIESVAVDVSQEKPAIEKEKNSVEIERIQSTIENVAVNVSQEDIRSESFKLNPTVEKEQKIEENVKNHGLNQEDIATTINHLDEAGDSVLRGLRRLTKVLDTETKKPLINRFENMKFIDYHFIKQKINELEQISNTQSSTTIKQNTDSNVHTSATMESNVESICWSNLIIKLEFILEENIKQIESMNLKVKQFRQILFIISAINNKFKERV